MNLSEIFSDDVLQTVTIGECYRALDDLLTELKEQADYARSRAEIARLDGIRGAMGAWATSSDSSDVSWRGDYDWAVARGREVAGQIETLTTYQRVISRAGSAYGLDARILDPTVHQVIQAYRDQALAATPRN